MNIKLYSVSQKNNVANKIKNLSPVFSGEVSPYMGVTNNGATFILDRLYNVNYGSFDFAGKHYYCYVSTALNSEGLYIYEFSIDALTTCYYNGAFNSEQLVLRDSVGNTRIFDLENPVHPYIERTVYDINDTVDDVYIVLNVLYPYNAYLPAAGEHYVGNRNITTYVLTPLEYSNFNLALIYDLSDAEQTQYVPSIISSFIVDEKFVNTNSLLELSNSNVILYKVNENHGDVSGKTLTVSVDPDHKIKRIKRNTSLTTTFTNVYQSNVNIDIDNINISGSFQILIRNIGKLNVRISDLDLKNITKINSIGYAVSINYLSGTYIAYLVVNGNIYREFTVSAPIKEQAILAYDSSISRWTDYSTSALGAVSGVVATGAGIATMNPIAIAGGITSLVGSGISAYDTFLKQDQGGYSVSGALGGNDDYQVNNGKSIIIFSRFSAIDKAGYENLYGRPCNEIKNLSTLTGYVKTGNCKFRSSLPIDVVQEGQNAVDQGIYII